MKWNYEEFKAYLLFEAAYGDLDFSEEEQDYIKSKLSGNIYDRIHEEFKNDKDFERIEKIKEAAQFYLVTPEKKRELSDYIMELFNADGKFSIMEKNLMLYLNRLIK